MVALLQAQSTHTQPVGTWACPIGANLRKEVRTNGGREAVGVVPRADPSSPSTVRRFGLTDGFTFLLESMGQPCPYGGNARSVSTFSNPFVGVNGLAPVRPVPTTLLPYELSLRNIACKTRSGS